VSTPVDPEFEMLVIACAINLFENLLQARFKTSAQEDLIILQQDIPMRKRFAVMHRYDCKTILTNNIRLAQILLRILARIVEETRKQPMLSKVFFK